MRPATIRAPSSPWRACSGSTLHYIAEAHQLLAIHVALPLASTISYSAAGLQPFTAQLRGNVLAPWRACSGSTLHYIAEAHDQLLAIRAALPLASTPEAMPPPASNLLRHSCVVTCLCTTAARSRPMNLASHRCRAPRPRPRAAILTYSTFDCSDAAHTMPLTSSLISRRFSSSTFRTHIRRPSACTRPNRSRAIRFGRHETLPRISHSPRASARMKLARFCVR